MSRLKYIGILIILIVALGLFFLLNRIKTMNTISEQKEIAAQIGAQPSTISHIVNESASFAIFTNGTFRAFTATMYHNLSPDVFIEASNPNVILIKKDGLTWNDFFSTLPFKLTYECLTTGTGQTFCSGSKGALKFYINGEKSVNALDQRINKGDKLLITFGNESEMVIKKQFDRIPN